MEFCESWDSYKVCESYVMRVLRTILNHCASCDFSESFESCYYLNLAELRQSFQIAFIAQKTIKIQILNNNNDEFMQRIQAKQAYRPF